MALNDKKMQNSSITAVGMGRMGRGIAISFALSGYTVELIDLKKRSKKQFIQLSDETNTEILDSISLLEKFNVLTQREAKKINSIIILAAASSFSHVIFLFTYALYKSLVTILPEVINKAADVD